MNAIKKITIVICFGVSGHIVSQNQPDSLGLPGDNFDLYGALDLFKKSATPEDFEKAINSNDNEVNNLDLDGDGKVDYVKVIDHQDKDAHTLVLQVDLSPTEKQDVAVIEIEKTNTDNAHIQIVGDEALYGKDYIIEPADENSTSTSAGTSAKSSLSSNDQSQTSSSSQPVIVNVWTWPSVQYVYTPAYSLWASPWYWSYYPTWWNPWTPIYWRYHYRRSYHYHYPYYHRTYVYRSPAAHSYYYGRRKTSGDVQRNNASGFYRDRQEVYKQNTEPDKKYNNLPAKRDLKVGENNLQPIDRSQTPKNEAPEKINVHEKRPVNPSPANLKSTPQIEKKQIQPANPTPVKQQAAQQRQIQQRQQAPKQIAPQQKQVRPVQQQPVRRSEAPVRAKPR